MLPYQAPSRALVRRAGPTLHAAVMERGLDAVAADFAARVVEPGSDTPAHLRRLLRNLAIAYSRSELEARYRALIAACLPGGRRPVAGAGAEVEAGGAEVADA